MGGSRNILELVYLTFLLGVAIPFAQGQTLSPKVSTFSSDDYKAHNQIFSVQPFPDGRTAFGTFRKVLIHDGESFRPIPVGAGKYVLAMDLDTAGRIFTGGISTMGVVTPDSSGRLIHRSLIPLLPDSLKDFGNIWDVTVRKEDGIYFNAFEHLFHYNGDTIEVIEPHNRFFYMHNPADGLVIQDVDTGLFRIKGNRRVHLPGSGELVRGKTIRAIHPTPGKEGKWTVFTAEKGLFNYDPEEGTIEGIPGGPEDGWASAVITPVSRLEPEENPFGAAFAVGTSLKGVYLLSSSGRIIHHLGREEGIPAKKVWNLAPTGGGNLWATTENGIALLHTGVPFTMVQEGSLFSGGVQDIERPPHSDAPLFLTTSQGAWAWRDEKEDFERLPGTAGQCFDLIPYSALSGKKSKSAEKGGRMLLAGNNRLSSFPFKKKKWETKTLLSKTVTSLALFPFRGRGRSGILAGGRDGFFALSSASFRESGPPDTLLSMEDLPEDIHSVGVERKGEDSLRLWAGFPSKGVMAVNVDTAFTGHRTSFHDTAGGVPKGSIHIFQDPLSKERDVVFGTESGLYRLNGETFVPDDRFGEVFSNGSRQVFRFKKGVDRELWINDWQGGQIKHLTPEKEKYHIDSNVFRYLDLGQIGAIHPEKGRTWFGGDQGLACFYPSVERDHERHWHCLVRKVRGAGDSLLFGGNYASMVEPDRPVRKDSMKSLLGAYIPVDSQPSGMIPELAYSHNRMEFQYAAPFTERQEAVEYSYMLTDFDTAWSKWTKETKKEYTNLPEGDYTFKVKARNVYLKESSTAKYRFKILPPWYRTWTAYGGYAVAGMGFIWFLLWLNSRRLVAQKQRLERIVEERTKEIQTEKVKVEKKNQALEEANETISKQKEEVEEQQRETKKQKQEVERAHEALEESHREITDSIDYAQKIQHALLQSEEHESPHLPDHFILFKPQATVSGDFYWAKEQNGHLYFAAVDCTGHGVPGAFMSMLGINQLNEIMATEELPTPGEVLTDLRKRVVAELSSGDPEGGAKDGMDAALVRIPLFEEEGGDDSRKLLFAGANNPLYVLSEGIGDEIPEISFYRQREKVEVDEGNVKAFQKTSKGFEVKGDKMAVGYEPDAADAFRTAELQVPRDAMIYMFSDGYADQFGGPKGKKFRYGPFKKLLAELHEKPVEEQKQELERTFEEWKAESQQEQIDDVVVVGVRV